MMLTALALEGSRAVSIIPYDLGQLVRGAEIIAKVRVTERVPVEFERDGRRVECGYVYSVTPIDSLKGGRSPFKVFASDRLYFTGFDSVYLVFAFPVNRDQARQRGVPPGTEDARFECEIGASRLAILEEPATFIPFIGEGSQEALAPSELSSILGATPDVGATVPWSIAREMIRRTVTAN